ncbi:MAG: hypothetical protein ACT4OG_01200 [Alphaproteobacteria bacterium]
MRSAKFTIFAFAGLLVMGGFALAADESQSSGNDDPNRIVCKAGKPPGSRLPGPRECHTKAEWDEIARASREAATETQMRMLQGQQPTRPGG